MPPFPLTFYLTMTFLTLPSLMRMMSASFMAIGFVIIIAFIDDKKRVLVSQARCLYDYVYGRHHSACAYLCHYPVDGGVVEHFRCEKRFFPLFSCWFRK